MAQTARDTITEHLRGEILRGVYPAGGRLPAERELAQRLGANRSSVREALRKLEQSGLVEIVHGGGATVLPIERASIDVIRHLLAVTGAPDRKLLEQVLEVHELLLVGGTRLAIEHGDPLQLDRARELLGQLADSSTDVETFLDTIEEVLGLIGEASGNLVLKMARRAVNPLFDERFREIRRRFRPPDERIRNMVAEIDQAIALRDADAAERALRSFLRAGRDQALEALSSYSSVGQTTADSTGDPR
ncbi:MAG: FadR family transcriptional regulator [Deltaproteobacteria bacterium]|nr:FadR family transcriptional regulator [Deltaproteobacteria bacterium]MBW2393050.1 FadR family transcriptional regulator [Deltaproteobacteria bacterium]